MASRLLLITLLALFCGFISSVSAQKQNSLEVNMNLSYGVFVVAEGFNDFDQIVGFQLTLDRPFADKKREGDLESSKSHFIEAHFFGAGSRGLSIGPSEFLTQWGLIIGKRTNRLRIGAGLGYFEAKVFGGGGGGGFWGVSTRRLYEPSLLTHVGYEFVQKRKVTLTCRIDGNLNQSRPIVLPTVQVKFRLFKIDRDEGT